ncbi:MAG TPA: ribosome biogenesis GTPase Der [Anaerolineae bacterium]|jgi:GTP-binding protein|nr:ribosome biogenesis GTPase Der [Anaerolineae bacterium]
MTYPLVAVVGRPNVGKSTLVNRIVVSQQAIVHEAAGVTRDRNYVDTEWGGKTFTIIDTGGIDFGTDVSLGKQITKQAMLAIDEADVIVFVVDGSVGEVAEDDIVAKQLRSSKKPVVLAVNKIDDIIHEAAIYQFYKLGLGEPYAVSAIHGLGVGDLLDAITALLPTVERVEDADEVKVAIVGRPNVGKSSVLNRFLGEERVIVSDIPGTTRDTIDTVLEKDGVTYRFIDTAGLRKQPRLKEDIEYYSFIRSLKALDRADIAVIVIDAETGPASQDQKIANLAEERGCASIIALNKWDLVESREKAERVETSLEKKLRFLDYSPKLKVSAKTGLGMSRMFILLGEVMAEYDKRVSTSSINGMVAKIKAEGFQPAKGGRTLKISYAAQTGSRPPVFVFFVNHPQLVTQSYERYIENQIRKTYGFTGCPINIHFRSKYR